jgi:hypothetical protein
LACPFFMPTHKHEDGTWLHPSRLPLGVGWKGYCTAPGHEGEIPSDEQLHQACNLGYAKACSRRPPDSLWDSIRFAVTRESSQSVLLCYVCETDHCPGEHGVLEYDTNLARWACRHRDFRIQKMAECYLESYLLRKNSSSGTVTS